MADTLVKKCILVCMNDLADLPTIKLPRASDTPVSYVESIVYNKELRKLVKSFRDAYNLSELIVAPMSENDKKLLAKVIMMFWDQALLIYTPKLDKSWRSVLQKYLLYGHIDEPPYQYLGYKKGSKHHAFKESTLSGKILYSFFSPEEKYTPYLNAEEELGLAIKITGRLKPRDIEKIKPVLIKLSAHLPERNWSDSSRYRLAARVMDYIRANPNATNNAVAAKFNVVFPNEATINDADRVKELKALAKQHNF